LLTDSILEAENVFVVATRGDNDLEEVSPQRIESFEIRFADLLIRR
jgi:hypothetical protein